ncbi:carbohydrate ABC transporter permease [Roseomonas sp. CCTCC AB2023176]|uniref:carbohydrate ABC transporter permease n=1 Tax=Roseomonas sp. CCTCC AB2023176 TaxID=3342640 RepID=UPI0035D7379C
MKRPIATLLAYAVALPVSAAFLFPYAWMISGALRSTRDVLSDPLRLIPANLDLGFMADIARIGGTPLGTYLLNSLLFTAGATVLGTLAAALGAYALTRRPRLPGFRLLRGGFLLTMMYPYMLLIIPVYIVMYRIGLLGSAAGIVLFLSLGPIQFFLFEQFFRAIPPAVIEAATIDGASEWQILLRVVLPMAMPVTATVALIAFLLNWAQWFPVLVISRGPETYTLPVALLSLNTELGASFQGVMALAVLTTLPPAILFLLAQRRVMAGMAGGAVKG